MTFESYDVNNSHSLTYRNMVETNSGVDTQLLIIPTMSEIDVSDDSIRIDQQRLYDEVERLCKEKKDFIEPGYYYARDAVLHFKNEDNSMILYKVSRNPRWKKNISPLDLPEEEKVNLSVGDKSRYKKNYVEPDKSLEEPIYVDRSGKADQYRVKPHLRDK